MFKYEILLLMMNFSIFHNQKMHNGYFTFGVEKKITCRGKYSYLV